MLTLEADRGRCVPLLGIAHQDETINRGGLDFEITAADGGQYTARNDTTVKFEVEESGPLRWQVRWEGTHRDDAGAGHFDFLVRMTVYAGQTFVRVDHTFFNRLDDDETHVKQLLARLPLELVDVSSYEVGTMMRGPASHQSNQPIRLEQLRFGEHRILDPQGATLVETHNQSVGWLNVNGAKQGVMLAPKAFWQNHPKAIGSDGAAITYELMPRRDTNFPVPRGMAKTHTFFLVFHEGMAQGLAASDLAHRVQYWPMPAAEAQHYVDTEALWDGFAYLPQKYPRLECSIREVFEPDVGHHRGPRALLGPRHGRSFGLKHYGDFICDMFSPAHSGSYDPDSPKAFYLNNEYDAVYVILTLFLHNRDITTWLGAEAHALHQMDVDTCHHALAKQIPAGLDIDCVLNCQWLQSLQHISVPGNSICTYAEGLVFCYYLTGDRRYLDAAVGFGDYIAHLQGYHQWGLGRGLGWALCTLSSVYQACPKDTYRAAAEALVDRVCTQIKDLGQPFSATYHPRALEDRVVGLTSHGLIRWHHATGDDRVKDLLLEMVHGYVDAAMLDVGLPMECTVPELARACKPGNGYAHMEALAFAYRATGDRRFIDAGMPHLCEWAAWINTPQLKTAGKHFMRCIRGVFPFLAVAHELDLLERVPAASAWLNTQPSLSSAPS